MVMKLHLYWFDKNYKAKGVAHNYNMLIDMQARTYKLWTNTYGDYHNSDSIEVVRKSDLIDYEKYLQSIGFKYIRA
jgi:hypothetical protein